MRALPRPTTAQLEEALKEGFDSNSTYRCVLTREQKQALRKGWQATGTSIDLGPTIGEHALYVVPGAPTEGGPTDPEPKKAAPKSTPKPVSEKKVAIKKKAPAAKTVLKKFVANKESRDAGSSSTGKE